MPDNADAHIFQVLRRQIRQDLLVDLILAERPLVSFKAKGPQPPTYVHDGALNDQPLRIVQPSRRVQHLPSRPKASLKASLREHYCA